MNNKPIWIKLLYLAIVVIMFNVTSFAQNQATDTQKWKLVKKKKKGEGWEVYKRKVSGSKLREFKIVGKVNFSAEKAQTVYWNMITDPDLRITKKGKSLGWVKVLERTEKEMVVYDFMEGNFPAKNRDVVVRYTLFKDSAENAMGVKWKHTDWESHEPTDTIIRMPFVLGSWSFKKIDATSCIATGSYRFHPGGNPPTWLINMVVRKTIPIELKHLRKSALKSN